MLALSQMGDTVSGHMITEEGKIEAVCLVSGRHTRYRQQGLLQMRHMCLLLAQVT